MICRPLRGLGRPLALGPALCTGLFSGALTELNRKEASFSYFKTRSKQNLQRETKRGT